MTRAALHYGVARCPGCFRSVSADGGLQLEVTGQTKRDKPAFMQGRKIHHRLGEKGGAIDKGPRFDASHERDFAELRHPDCGRTWWVTGLQAVEDAVALQNGRPMRELAPLPIPESLGGPAAPPPVEKKPAPKKKRRA